MIDYNRGPRLRYSQDVMAGGFADCLRRTARAVAKNFADVDYGGFLAGTDWWITRLSLPLRRACKRYYSGSGVSIEGALSKEHIRILDQALAWAAQNAGKRKITMNNRQKVAALKAAMAERKRACAFFSYQKLRCVVE